MVVSKDRVTDYTWGAGCKAWPLVDTDKLSVKEEAMAAGTTEKRHLHAQSRQFFYILAGVASLEVAGKDYEMSTGEGMEVAPGLQHCIRNNAEEALRFLVISAPSTASDRIDMQPG